VIIGFLLFLSIHMSWSKRLDPVRIAPPPWRPMSDDPLATALWPWDCRLHFCCVYSPNRRPQ
jgi:hypothetical protein